MRYPPIFATIFSKNICKTRENVWCTFMSPSSSFNNYGHFFLLSCYLAKEIPHHTFPPEDRTCHAFILSCAFSWCRHTEEHVSGARSLTGGSPIWQMASWWLQKKQLPWWSSFAAQLWELVLRMQPRICFFSSPTITVKPLNTHSYVYISLNYPEWILSLQLNTNQSPT